MGVPAPSTSPLVRRYRLEEFYELEPPPGGGHYELIGGVLYMVPQPAMPHSLAAARMIRLLSRYQDHHSDLCTLFVPRTGVIWTAEDTYLEPDMFLISNERFVGDPPPHPSTADLVVEIHSPSTAVYDRTTKADTYAALGVRELWLVDLEKRVIEQRLLVDGRWDVRGPFGPGTTLVAVAFPDLAIAPAEIFA